ncbi:MAG: ribosome maturation factor RimP [Myxococcota bacterium]
MYREIPEHLRVLIEPVVEDHGCQLVDVQVQLGHGVGMVRVILDNARGDGCVAVEQCAAVSRELGVQLDAADAISGRYRLEVSSPGLDRVLAREMDFAAARGQEVKIQTKRPLDGRRRFHGILVGFENDIVRVVGDGQEMEIPFEEIKKARSVYQFDRADFVLGAE